MPPQSCLGTTYKAKWVDVDGFQMPEGHLMARYLLHKGIKEENILIEGYSDDTLGNAVLARMDHLQWAALSERATTLVVTSDFHQPRTKLIYEWMTTLKPHPESGPIHVEVVGVSDKGAFPPRILQLRRRKEEEATQKMKAAQEEGEGPLVMTTMHRAHRWLFTAHGAYKASVSGRGVALKKMSVEDRQWLETY